jgi:hypothetical protein
MIVALKYLKINEAKSSNFELNEKSIIFKNENPKKLAI